MTFTEQIAAAVDRLCQSAAETWPDVGEVDREAFAAHLARGIESETHLGRILDGGGAVDVYLAFACMTGAPGAARTFEAAFAPSVRSAIGRVVRDRATAEDVEQQLFARLLAPEPGERSKLAEFDGSGSLEGWLRVVAARDALSLVKKTRREVSLGEALAEVPLVADDPETAFVKAAYRADYRAAFAAAVAALDDGQRLVLRQHYIQRLGIDRIGELLGIHRASAARRVSQAREELLAGTRRELLARLGLAREEMEQMVGLIESNLELSLRRLLGE